MAVANYRDTDGTFKELSSLSVVGMGNAETEQQKYEEGKKAEYDAFWDGFQDYGNRIHYHYGFASHFGWNATNFKPKYDIIPVQATYIFYGFKQPSLKPFLDDRGLKLDFSKCKGMTYAFMASELTELGTIDISSAGTVITGVFQGCTNLVTIEKLIMASTNKNNMFNDCPNLENLTIEGVIGNNFVISACTKLTHASLMSIIDHLEPKTSGTFTLTIGSENIAKLTTEELKLIENKGWTYQ